MKRDMTGKIVVITGGSSGIGAAAARALSKLGARVVITGRSSETEKIARETGADFFLVDFAKLEDVRRFARQLLEKYPRLDVLVNNAGSIISKRRETADGFEATFQVNHLAGFLLTNLLRERLEESGAIVINTSSLMNTLGRIDFEDLQHAKNYSDSRAYSNTKLMNILHAMEIAKRFKGVNVASFHPGPVMTSFTREGSWMARMLYETPLKHLFLITPEKGADTLVWLATHQPGEDWVSGEYYHKRKTGRRSRQAEPETAAKLWAVSEKMLS